MGLTEAGNRPPRPAHADGLSKSATKARIGPKHRKRIVDISRFPPRPISLRSAFVADLDTPPPRPTSQAPPAPLGQSQNNLQPSGEKGSLSLSHRDEVLRLPGHPPLDRRRLYRPLRWIIVHLISASRPERRTADPRPAIEHGAVSAVRSRGSGASRPTSGRRRPAVCRRPPPRRTFG